MNILADGSVIFGTCMVILDNRPCCAVMTVAENFNISAVDINDGSKINRAFGIGYMASIISAELNRRTLEGEPCDLNTLVKHIAHGLIIDDTNITRYSNNNQCNGC